MGSIPGFWCYVLFGPRIRMTNKYILFCTSIVMSVGNVLGKVFVLTLKILKFFLSLREQVANFFTLVF